jgi:hypothetical protein
MLLDPFSDLSSRMGLIGIIIIAAQKENLQIWRLPKSRYLVPSFLHNGFVGARAGIRSLYRSLTQVVGSKTIIAGAH